MLKMFSDAIGSLFEPFRFDELNVLERQLLCRIKDMRGNLPEYDQRNGSFLADYRRSGLLARKSSAERIGLSHWWQRNAKGRDHLKKFFNLMYPTNEEVHAEPINNGLSSSRDANTARQLLNDYIIRNTAPGARRAMERDPATELDELSAMASCCTTYMFDGQTRGRRAEISNLLEQLSVLRSRLKYKLAAKLDEPGQSLVA